MTPPAFLPPIWGDFRRYSWKQKEATFSDSIQKGALLLFHLMFIILCHQRHKCQLLLLEEEQCVGVTKGKQAGELSQERSLIVCSLSTESNGHIKWSWEWGIINSSGWNSVSCLHVSRGGMKGFVSLFYFLRLLWQHPPPAYALGCCKDHPNLASHQW